MNRFSEFHGSGRQRMRFVLKALMEEATLTKDERDTIEVIMVTEHAEELELRRCVNVAMESAKKLEKANAKRTKPAAAVVS